VTTEVHNNSAQHRFELDVGDGQIAVAYYQLAPGVVTFTHTEVPQQLWGRGIGSKVARGAFEYARAQGLKVVAKCPFMSAYAAKHPEFNDLLR
jgi:predicted GNAT family acetyltransferase